MMFLAVVFLPAMVAAFSWQDCGTDPNRAIHITSIAASPHPLVVPGKLNLAFAATLTKDLVDVQLKLDVRRKLLIGSVHVPCVDGFGSCVVSACDYLDNRIAGPSAGAAELAKEIKTTLQANNLDYKCTFHAKTFSFPTSVFNIPPLGTLSSLFANGDYEIKVEARDPATNELFGCLQLQASLSAQ